MRRAPLVLGATVVGLGAVLSYHPHSTPLSSATTTTTTASGGKVVTGAPASNQYGTVQVKVTVENGKIVDVAAVQLPQSDPKSSEISSFAAPQLASQAKAAQSAQIDGVSGASYTSGSYEQSLQSAIDQAGLARS